MTKARKEYGCQMTCGLNIEKGDVYQSWMEAEPEEDFIGSKTVAMRVHDECYDLFVALGGDPWETSPDSMMEFIEELLYKTQEEGNELRLKYSENPEKYYDLSWVVNAIDSGERPKFETFYHATEESTKLKNEAWDKWMAWRKGRAEDNREVEDVVSH